MDSLEIKKILQSYLSGKLPIADIQELKNRLDLMDDVLLDHNLKSLWEDYTTKEHNRQAHEEIAQNLSRMIAPVRNKCITRSMINWSVRIAAAILLPVLLLTTVYLYTERNALRSIANYKYQVQAAKGERSTLLLPDGTRVSLNSSSTISYSSSFANGERSVELSGEAYFEVQRDELHPFVVHTKEAEIKVLGTVFNVYVNPDDRVFEATLVEGSVEVTPTCGNHNSVVLRPNQKICFDKQSNVWKVSDTDLWTETAWKRGDLVFRSKPLSHIIEKLEMFYGVSIHVEGEYPEELFTSSFHESEIYPVLFNLQEHYDFTFVKSGNSIKLTFNY